MPPPRPEIFITGTDPGSRAGGIGFALSGYLDALRAAAMTTEVIPTYSPVGVSGKWWPWLSALPRLARRVRAARRRGASPVVYSHAGAGASLLREGVVLRVAKACGANTVLQLHCPAAEHYLGHRWKSRLLRFAFAAADEIWVLTPWWKTLLQQHGIQRPVRIVPNPLPEEWAVRAARARPPAGAAGPVRILCMARVEQGKGVDLSVEAMAHLDARFQLVVAGDGAQLDAIRARATALGLSDTIVFAGWVSGAQKQRLIDEADLFCLPTVNDSFGMGFLEAMANGLPVVALRWGPVPDVVPDGVAGVLVERADPRAVAAAITRVAAPELRERLGQGGQQWVLEQFGHAALGARMRRFFHELAGR